MPPSNGTNLCVRLANDVHAPVIWHESDGDEEEFHHRRGFWLSVLVDASQPSDLGNELYLPSSHEFYRELRKQKGRPKTRRRSGPKPKYPDRIAVGLATLKDNRGLGYARAAKRLGVRTTHPNLSEQSDTARYLVARGRRLIANAAALHTEEE